VGISAGYGFTPAPVALRDARGGDPSPLDALAAGGNRGCARRADGAALCWTTAVGAAQPPLVSEVPGLRDVVSLAVRWPVTCAVRADHRAWCWGPASVEVVVPMPAPSPAPR
jgi:hypothetical protein